MSSNIRGTYTLASISLLVAAVVILYALVMPIGPTARWTLSIALTLAAALIALEARRDPLAAAKFGAVVCGLFVVVAGGGWSLATDPSGHMRSIALGLASLVGFAVCVHLDLRESRKTDVVPNLLLAQFDPRVVFETEGVQWVGTQGPMDLRTPSFVCVHLQNCVEAPRRVKVSLDEPSWGRSRRGSRVAPIEPVELGPGEAVTLTIPVSAGPRAHHDIELYVAVRARGGAGRRLRVFRGQAATSRVTLPMQILGAVAGYAIWGGGVRFRFVNGVPVADESASVGETSTRTVWTMAAASVVDTTTSS